MNLIKALGLELKSWHVFRKKRMKRIYKCLREFIKWLNRRTQARKVIIVDGKLFATARLSRALTQRIKRGFGGKGWGRRRRKLYSEHQGKEIQIDELVYGILIMAVVDEKGRVIDVWIKPASTSESKALRERIKKSSYLREMLEGKTLLADKGYRGIREVEIAGSKRQKAIRQVVEGFFAKVRYLQLSGWRNIISLLSYLSALAIASFFKPY